eukprot:3363273-Prymnesium_polylepis.1
MLTGSGELENDTQEESRTSFRVSRAKLLEAFDPDVYWPPARETLHRTTLEILTLHNCPKVGGLPCGLCHSSPPLSHGSPDAGTTFGPKLQCGEHFGCRWSALTLE